MTDFDLAHLETFGGPHQPSFASVDVPFSSTLSLSTPRAATDADDWDVNQRMLASGGRLRVKRWYKQKGNKTYICTAKSGCRKSCKYNGKRVLLREKTCEIQKKKLKKKRRKRR